MTMADVFLLARNNPDTTRKESEAITAFTETWYPEIFSELEDLEIRIIDKGEYLEGEVLA